MLGARGAALALWSLTVLPTAVAPLAPGLKSPYGDLLSEADNGFQAIVSAGLWAVFAAIAVTLLLPGALALTAARIVVPANAAASLWAAASVDEISPSGHGFALAAGIAAAVTVLLPAFADAVVNVGSYGDERRYLLRPPGPVLVAAVVPMWAVAVVGAGAGPLLMADRRWAIGAAAIAGGAPAAALAWVVLYRLARRWLVFVPGGLVIHDHMAITQPTPLQRRGISYIRPASSGTSAFDFTAQAFGLALELRLKTPVSVAVVADRGKPLETAVSAMLISPSRPAAVMATARQRGIAIR